MVLIRVLFLSIWLALSGGLVFAEMAYAVNGFGIDLGRDETVDFCVTELGRKIGAENALEMEGHCLCATDLVLEKTPDSLKEPFARLVRRQSLRAEDKAAFKAESGNFFVYLAMLDNRCPRILSDPLLQKLLLSTP